MPIQFNNYSYIGEVDSNKDENSYAFDGSKYRQLCFDQDYESAADYLSNYKFTPDIQKQIEESIIEHRQMAKRYKDAYTGNNIKVDDVKKIDLATYMFEPGGFDILTKKKYSDQSTNEYAERFIQRKRELGSILDSDGKIKEESTAIELTFHQGKRIPFGVKAWDILAHDNDFNIEKFYEFSHLTEAQLNNQNIQVIKHKDGSSSFKFDKTNPLANLILCSIPTARNTGGQGYDVGIRSFTTTSTGEEKELFGFQTDSQDQRWYDQFIGEPYKAPGSTFGGFLGLEAQIRGNLNASGKMSDGGFQGLFGDNAHWSQNERRVFDDFGRLYMDAKQAADRENVILNGGEVADEMTLGTCLTDDLNVWTELCKYSNAKSSEFRAGKNDIYNATSDLLRTLGPECTLYSNFRDNDEGDETLQETVGNAKTGLLGRMGSALANKKAVINTAYVGDDFGLCITMDAVYNPKAEFNNGEIPTQVKRIQAFISAKDLGLQDGLLSALKNDVEIQARQELKNMKRRGYAYTFSNLKNSDLEYGIQTEESQNNAVLYMTPNGYQIRKDNPNDPTQPFVRDLSDEEAVKFMTKDFAMNSSLNLKYPFMNNDGDITDYESFDLRCLQYAIKTAKTINPNISKVLDTMTPAELRDALNASAWYNSTYSYDQCIMLKDIYDVYTDAINKAKPFRNEALEEEIKRQRAANIKLPDNLNR